MLFKIMKLLGEHKKMSFEDIKNALDVDESAISKMIDMLISKGKIKEINMNCDSANKSGCSRMSFSACKSCYFYKKTKNSRKFYFLKKDLTPPLHS